MRRLPTQFSLLLLSYLLISACSSVSSNDTHKAVCNQLKSNLIFNGSTNITREADIQNAESPLTQRTYDADNC